MVSGMARRRAGKRPRCPGHLIGLSVLAVLSVITTTILGKALSTRLVSVPELNGTRWLVEDESKELLGDVTIARDYFIGPCLVHTNQSCPDEEITFFLYTRKNEHEAQQIRVNDTFSNLRETFYAPEDPTKIIVHGYNSDMQLDALVDIRREYLKRDRVNVIAVDWHRLAVGPCYPFAVHNVPHVGRCLAQLIERLRESGTTEIHAIGFSLGAHVPAYSANYLRPYKISRITGLDPAMPLFVTSDKDEKLDPGDAHFVDVLHTNALIQGKIEPSGHVDFYMNGGVNQPGCWQHKNPFGCDHHRSALYFAESINSKIGFWGWPCSGFWAYLMGLCPPRFPAVLAGADANSTYRGYFVVKTRAQSPFAEGPFLVNDIDQHVFATRFKNQLKDIDKVDKRKALLYLRRKKNNGILQ